jgi:hypothetical protein
MAGSIEGLPAFRFTIGYPLGAPFEFIIYDLILIIGIRLSLRFIGYWRGRFANRPYNFRGQGFLTTRAQSLLRM